MVVTKRQFLFLTDIERDVNVVALANTGYGLKKQAHTKLRGNHWHRLLAQMWSQASGNIGKTCEMSAPDKVDTSRHGTEWCSEVRVGLFLCQFCFRCLVALGKRRNKLFLILLWLVTFYSQVKTWTSDYSQWRHKQVDAPYVLLIMSLASSLDQSSAHR